MTEMAAEIWNEAEVAEKQAEGQAARVTFDRTLTELKEALAGGDPIEVLARAFLHILFWLSNDPDESKKGMEVFHLEILQALALATPVREVSTQEQSVDMTSQCVPLIMENSNAFQRLWQVKLSSDQAHNQLQLQLALLRDWAMAVRGPRHTHQTWDYLEAIAKGVEGPFITHFECSAAATVQMIKSFQKMMDGRIERFTGHMRRWMTRKRGSAAKIDAFTEGMSEADARRLRAKIGPHSNDAKKVEIILWNEVESALAPLLTFSLKDILTESREEERLGLRMLFDSLALGFGEVSDSDLEHLHLDNPVRLKPFIRLEDGTYVCANPFSFGTNLSDIFEEVCNRHASTKRALEKTRASWLETKLVSVVSTYFPSAEVHQSVMWTDPDSGKGWESDVVAVIDKTVIIFEAKSAKIQPAAKRGATGSLKEALRDLVVKPSEQSFRLKQYIQNATATLTFQSKTGSLVVDALKVKDIIRVNVLLDPVGPLSAHWPRLKAIGLVPQDSDLAPTMSVFELETVCEVLTLELERCHYLSRRVIFERNVGYVADELDLLAFYIETQFNIGDLELENPEYWLWGRSLKLTHAYSEKRVAGTLSFPIRRAPLWDRLLAALERHKHPGWTRFGHRLLNVDLKAQRRFEKTVYRGFKAMARSPGNFFTSGLTIGLGERKQTIAFLICGQVSPELFEENLRYATQSAAEQGGVPDLLLIQWFYPKTGEGYDFIGIMRQVSMDAFH